MVSSMERANRQSAVESFGRDTTRARGRPRAMHEPFDAPECLAGAREITIVTNVSS